MSGFWLILLALLIAVSGLLLIAGGRGQRPVAEDRDALNTAFYHQRLRELEDDEAQGVVGERPEMIRELQQTLLMDIPPEAKTEERSVGRWVLIPGVIILFVVSLGFYFKTGGYDEVVSWQQTASELPALRAQVMDPGAKPLSMEQLARLGLGLRTSLQQDPDNLNDWLMLGRVGMVLNNGETATQAFRHALQLAPDNDEVQLSYADVMSRSQDPEDVREAGVMLNEMKQRESGNLRILSLLAFNAYAQQHYAQAAGVWQQMLLLLPADDRRREMIQRSIAQAEAKTGKVNGQLALTITLVPTAEKMLQNGGVLYISVSDGVSPVPMAVKKMPLSHFPLSLTLDDSNAMMPGRLLSAQHQVQVRVRISRDGSATPQSGDWFGTSAVTPFDGQQQLAVEIDRQQP
ncbi:c-type cytochrome biogenesis protein CcmI [Erwinia sp. P6884]|uniref:c-type cytochrome biogenesis protein CcmI n=1 Tax=Erwinia sp. P6884 TaxID=3141450 RepID=UPI00319A011D